MEPSADEVSRILREAEKIIKTARRNTEKDSCWWDSQRCPFQSSVAGFQTLNYLCQGCCQVDWKKFTELAEDLPAIENLVSEAEIKAKEEGVEEGKKIGEEEARKKFESHFERVEEFCEEIKKLFESLMEKFKLKEE